MKFFSPAACDTLDELEPFRKVYEDHRAHLASLKGAVPEATLGLFDLAGVDDGLIVKVDRNREANTLKIVMRCGHLQMGYYNLVITYKDAHISEEHDRVLAKIARSTLRQNIFGCDLAYHELTVSDEQRLEHSIIFNAMEWHHPSAGGWLWFTVSCSELNWRTVPKRSRRLHPFKDRYPTGPTL